MLQPGDLFDIIKPSSEGTCLLYFSTFFIHGLNKYRWAEIYYQSFTMTEVVAEFYKFEINYSLTKCRFDIAELYSPKFTFGGLDWALVYVPPSLLEEKIYLDLELQCETEDVKVTFDLSLLDRDGNPSLTAFKRAFHTFSDKGEVDRLEGFVHKKELEKEHLKKDVNFFVLCTLFISGGSANMVAKSNPVTVSLNSLRVHLGCLLECPEMSDITFNVYGAVFHAHKAILAARSPVLKQNCSVQWLKQEKNTS